MDEIFIINMHSNFQTKGTELYWSPGDRDSWTATMENQCIFNMSQLSVTHST